MKSKFLFLLLFVMMTFVGCSENTEIEKTQLDEKQTLSYLGGTAGYVSDYLDTVMSLSYDASSYDFTEKEKSEYIESLKSIKEYGEAHISAMLAREPHEDYDVYWEDIFSFIELTVQLTDKIIACVEDDGEITKLYGYLEESVEAVEKSYDPVIKAVMDWFAIENGTYSKNNGADSDDSNDISGSTKVAVSGGFS